MFDTYQPLDAPQFPYRSTSFSSPSLYSKLFASMYRNKGYNFTITSSTANDQKWSYGRTIYDPISQVVDEMFENFLSRPNVIQPILTQYCDGRTVTCPNWLSQWGSKYLGDQGYSAIQILRNYYGSSIYINSADEISGIPSSWPGYDLTIGSSGSKVRQMQPESSTIRPGIRFPKSMLRSAGSQSWYSMKKGARLTRTPFYKYFYICTTHRGSF